MITRPSKAYFAVPSDIVNARFYKPVEESLHKRKFLEEFFWEYITPRLEDRSPAQVLRLQVYHTTAANSGRLSVEKKKKRKIK